MSDTSTREVPARELKVGDVIVAKGGRKARYLVVHVMPGLGAGPYLTLKDGVGGTVEHETGFDSRDATYTVEPFVIRPRETPEELKAREDRFARAKDVVARYERGEATRAEQAWAVDEMWRTSLGPADPPKPYPIEYAI